jgi:hypothetical protein
VTDAAASRPVSPRPAPPPAAPAAPPGLAAPAVRRGGVGGIGPRGLALAVVVAGLAIGSTAMALAALAAFERALLTTVDSRLSEVANEVARHVENGLQAGVALEQQRRLLAVLADERSQAPELSTIRVVDDRGRILFSTNEAEIGELAAATEEALAPPAVAAPEGPGPEVMGPEVMGPEGRGPAPWREDGDTAITYVLPMTGLFGEALGAVTVALPRDAVADQRERFALSLLMAAAAITAAGGLLAALLLALLPLPATRRLQRLRQRLEALERATGEAQPTLPADVPRQEHAALPAELARFEAWLGLRLDHLGAREAEVRRLDETA